MTPLRSDWSNPSWLPSDPAIPKLQSRIVGNPCVWTLPRAGPSSPPPRATHVATGTKTGFDGKDEVETRLFHHDGALLFAILCVSRLQATRPPNPTATSNVNNQTNKHSMASKLALSRTLMEWFDVEHSVHQDHHHSSHPPPMKEGRSVDGASLRNRRRPNNERKGERSAGLNLEG